MAEKGAVNKSLKSTPCVIGSNPIACTNFRVEGSTLKLKTEQFNTSNSSSVYLQLISGEIPDAEHRMLSGIALLVPMFLSRISG